MPTAAQKANPSTPGLFHSVMDPKWHMMNALLGGTEEMRLQGQVYLPKHSREYITDYDARLKRSILINYYELTLDTLSGKPFSEPLKFSADVPKEIKGSEPDEGKPAAGGWIEDIDLEGTGIDRFAANVFRDGVAKGFTHILVDAPASGDPTVTRTRKEELDQNIRPYMVHIRPEMVIAAQAIRENGREVLTHIRFYETETEQEGFAEVEITYIRSLTLQIDPSTGTRSVVSESFKLLPGKTANRAASWQSQGKKPTDLEFIPLFTFYSQRAGFMLSKPPLLDLAYMNVLHFQRYSDHINALTVASFPILGVSGVEPEDAVNVTIGPRNVLALSDPQGKYYYIENQGTALAAGKENITDLENQMGLYGASLLRKRPDRETATSRSINEKNSTSSLQRMALSFKDVLENCFTAMAKLGGLGDDGGSIIIHTDFAFEGGDVVDLQTLQVAYKDHAISRVAFITELKRRGILAEDYHTEADGEELKAEMDAKIAAFYDPVIDQVKETNTGLVDVAQTTADGAKTVAETNGDNQIALADKNAKTAVKVAKTAAKAPKPAAAAPAKPAAK